MNLSIRLAIVAALLACAANANAQITNPRTTSVGTTRVATLEEQLVNRLRATRDDQKAYIKYVVKQVEEEKLEQRLVVAVENYSIRRNRGYPFPFFERAIRYEAAKRGVTLPPIRNFATTRILPSTSP